MKKISWKKTCPKCHKNNMWLDLITGIWHCHSCDYTQQEKGNKWKPTTNMTTYNTIGVLKDGKGFQKYKKFKEF